jgi:hypothetical protein
MITQTSLRYQVQDGEAYYEVGMDPDIEPNAFYAQKYYYPRPGWKFRYGITVSISLYRKRARGVLKIWSESWNAWGFGMDGIHIVSQKFIDLSLAYKLREDLVNIENEQDEIERLVLALELAKKILNLMIEEEKI